MGWNRVCSSGRYLTRSAKVLLPTIALLVGITGASQSQVITSISNSYITASIGVSGTAANVTPTVNLAGRIGITDASARNLVSLVNSATKQSYITVRIDGGAPTPGADAATQTAPGWDLIFGDVGSNALDGTTTNAKTDQGAWVQVPTAINSTTLTAIWKTLPGSNTTVPIPAIQVKLTMTLVHDMVRYQFEVTNTDNRAHSVGIRFAQDFNIPGQADGPVITPNLGQIRNESDYYSTQVPSYWKAQSPDATISVGATLLPAAGTSTSATRPDRLIFGNPVRVGGSIWAFTADPTYSFTTTGADAAAAAYFSAQQYSPSETKTIVTYLGRQASSIDFDAPFAAGVGAPLTIAYDPKKPAGQQLTPSPFAVSAFALNQTQLALTNVTAVISLPKGLTLAPNQSATLSVATLAPSAETTYAWNVIPDGTASGRLTYSVAFTAGPGTIGKVVTRDIDIPALPSQSFGTDLQMVSVPYIFTNGTPATALGLKQYNFDLVRWNPVSQVYEAVTLLNPGEGYWMFNRTGAVLGANLAGASPVNTGGANFEAKLKTGWNQIGNPFLYRLRWADVQVVSTDVGNANYLVPLTIDAAAAKGLILSTLYYYDPSIKDYGFAADNSTLLVPYQGYWVKALQPNVSLLFSPSINRSATINSIPNTAAPINSTNWTIHLKAADTTGLESHTVIGIAPGASDTMDRKDIEAPPAIANRISLRVSHPEWGRSAGLYAQDIQAGNGGKKQWNLIVSSPKPNTDVVLSWSDVVSIPRNYELYITDTATGTRRTMRQTSTLRVNTGDNATRSLVVSAEPRSTGVFRILSPNIVTNGSRSVNMANITFTTTQEASISVRVINSTGQTVRTIATRAAAAQTNTILWDHRDSRGSAVPAGSYRIEIIGTPTEGDSVRVLVPYVVVR